LSCDSIRPHPETAADHQEQVVAKHRKPKKLAATKPRKLRKRHSPSVFLVGAGAVGLSTLLVFGHATDNTADALQVQLANAVLGIGGRGDPDAVNIPNKLSGTVVPNGYTYIPVHYPAGFDIENSTNAGVPSLDTSLKTAASNPNNPMIIVVGYSEGALVADKEKRNLATDPNAPPPTQVSFMMIASPNVPNGGIFGRFPTLVIPFFVTSNGPAQPSAYSTTYETLEYDTYADFPAYFNPLSLLNTLFAVQYVHPDQYYDALNPVTSPHITTVVGNDTYVFYPNPQLPLLAPERQIFGIFGLTPLTEPVLSAFEPLLRVLVDMGYTDRQNLNPGVPTTFSLFTPPEKILEALAAIPGALTQGANNFVTGVSEIPNSIPAPVAPVTTLAPTNSPSINIASVPQGSQQDTVLDSPPKTPSPSLTPPTTSLSPLTNQGPKLNVVTDDGGKVGSNGTSTTTSPGQGNPLSQLTGTITGLLGGNQTPSSTQTSTQPSSTPSSSTPSGSTSQTQGAA
jgi:diacyltrehalose acyltransferase